VSLLTPFGGGRPAGLADMQRAVDEYETPMGQYLGARVDSGFWTALNGAALGGAFKRYGLPTDALTTLTEDPAETMRLREFRTTPTVTVPPPFRESEVEFVQKRLDAKGIEYLKEEDWRAGPFYRDMPFEPYMTRERAKAKAEYFDVARFRDWQREKRPDGVMTAVLGFGAEMVGGAPDPVNFVAFGGWAAKGATLLRTMGRGALEVGAVTAATEPLLAKNLAYWGDDLTFADAVLDIAVGAATGGIFAGGGRVARILGERKTGRQGAALADADQALREAAALTERAEPGYDPTVARHAPDAMARLNETVGDIAAHQPADPTPTTREFSAGIERLQQARDAAAERAQAPPERVAELGDVLAAAGQHGKVAADLGPVQGDVARQVNDALRGAGVEVDVAGFRHEVDNYAIRHASKEHGLASREAPRGQLPLTEVDFRRIPDVLAGPDRVASVGKTRIGRDGIGYWKSFDDGTLLYLEEVRTGRKRLAMVSMRKFGGGPGRPHATGGGPQSHVRDALPGPLDTIAPPTGPVKAEAPEARALAEVAEPAPDPLKDADADPDVLAYRELETAGAVKADDAKAFAEADAEVKRVANIERAYEQASVCLARSGA